MAGLVLFDDVVVAEMSDVRTTTVLIYRPKGWWNQQRRYYVWLDHMLVGKLRRGEQLAVQIGPGRHVVRARVASTGSVLVPFEATEGSRETRVRVQYAGDVFFFSALWRGFTFTRWLEVIVEDPVQQVG